MRQLVFGRTISGVLAAIELMDKLQSAVFVILSCKQNWIKEANGRALMRCELDANKALVFAVQKPVSQCSADIHSRPQHTPVPLDGPTSRLEM
jgi:hypothetical protein